MERLLGDAHLDQDVAGIQLPLDRHLLAVLDLDRFLDRDQRLPHQLGLFRTRIVGDPLLEQVAHLVLVPCGGLDRVPAVFHGLPRNRGDAVHQDLLEHEVDDADGQPQRDAQDDDHAGRLHELVAGRPRDLPHLGAGGLEERPGAGQPSGLGLRPGGSGGVRHLLRFLVTDVLVAVRAVLPHLNPLRMLPLVLVEEEVPVLAVGALEDDLVSRHCRTLLSIVDKGDSR